MFSSSKPLEETFDTPQEILARHQALCQRVSQLALFPTNAGGPPAEYMAQFNPTSFGGERIPDSDLSFKLNGPPPSVHPLPAYNEKAINPATGKPVALLEEILASQAYSAQTTESPHNLQRFQMSFVSVKGSFGSLVHGYNGLGGQWFIQGFLRVKNNNDNMPFKTLNITAGLKFSCGGRSSNGTYGGQQPYEQEVAPIQKVLLSDNAILDANGVAYYPFQFALNQSFAQAFNPIYSRYNPFAGAQLVGTLRFIEIVVLRTKYGTVVQQRVAEKTVEYNVPVPVYHRAGITSLLSPAVPKSLTKNAQSKHWTARWTANLERSIVGRGDAINVDVTLHSIKSHDPLIRLQVSLVEVIGYKETNGKTVTPRLEQAFCAITRLPLTGTPSSNAPHTVQLVVPKELPQTRDGAPINPQAAMNAVNPDGEWCGYIVTHVVRVAIMGGKNKDKPHMLDAIELPVVILGFGQESCQVLSSRFPYVAESLTDPTASVVSGMANLQPPSYNSKR